MRFFVDGTLMMCSLNPFVFIHYYFISKKYLVFTVYDDDELLCYILHFPQDPLYLFYKYIFDRRRYSGKRKEKEKEKKRMRKNPSRVPELKCVNYFSNTIVATKNLFFFS